MPKANCLIVDVCLAFCWGFYVRKGSVWAMDNTADGWGCDELGCDVDRCYEDLNIEFAGQICRINERKVERIRRVEFDSTTCGYLVSSVCRSGEFTYGMMELRRWSRH